jgi:hypothetical protein
MRVRFSFICNSSSCSFILDRHKLCEGQLVAIRDHINFGKTLGFLYTCPEDAWYVSEDVDTVKLDTNMDNFDMDDFLGKIGALGAVIERDHS